MNCFCFFRLLNGLILFSCSCSIHYLVRSVKQDLDYQLFLGEFGLEHMSILAASRDLL